MTVRKFPRVSQRPHPFRYRVSHLELSVGLSHLHHYLHCFHFMYLRGVVTWTWLVCPPAKGSWAGISFPLGGNKKAEFNPALIFRGEPFTMTHKVIPVGVQDEALWLNPSGLIRKDVRGCRLMHSCLWPQVLLRTLSTRRYNLDHGHPER